ncbi:MAG: helix-turn-helix domain-containing protein [Acidimicrobiales bacterium]
MDAGDVLRSARRRAGLTQLELARRCGTTQSVISAYESGARRPSLDTLSRLVGGTGIDLDLRLVRRHRAARPAGSLAARVSRQRDAIREIVTRHGMDGVRLFGSVARGEEHGRSDVDLLVDVPPGIGLLTLGRCQEEIEALLGVPVDLVPANDLKPGVAPWANGDAVRL